jgi:SprT protein|tara:strand:- start:468 stop:959 length:492 start_codon:yes stop_codon:yes gene_type:complete
MMYEELIKERLTTLNQAALDWFDYDEDLPKLTWDLKGTVGGQAYLNQNMIRINMEALAKYKDHYIKQTIGHEFAHLVAYKALGHRGHGRSWARVMRKFNLFPDRCHDYDLTPARVVKRQYLYECDKCGKEFTLTAIRHNKMQKGKQRYRHSTDGGQLVYKGKV